VDDHLEVRAAVPAKPPRRVPIAWWFVAGHHEIRTFLPTELRLNAHAAFFAASALAFALLARRLRWSGTRWPGFVLLPALVIVAFLESMSQAHPFANYGWLAWSFALAVQVFLLRDLDSREERGDGDAVLHAGTFLLAAALGAWEMHWAAVQVTARGTSWSVASTLLVPAILLLLAVSKEMDGRWPLTRHLHAYRLGAVCVTLVAMALWVLYANATHDGSSAPLPYLPLLNAIFNASAFASAIVFAASICRFNTLAVPSNDLFTSFSEASMLALFALTNCSDV